MRCVSNNIKFQIRKKDQILPTYFSFRGGIHFNLFFFSLDSIFYPLSIEIANTSFAIIRTDPYAYAYIFVSIGGSATFHFSLSLSAWTIHQLPLKVEYKWIHTRRANVCVRLPRTKESQHKDENHRDNTLSCQI